jgi:hypothetical protein
MTVHSLRNILRASGLARTGATILLAAVALALGSCKPPRHVGPPPDIRITSASLSATGGTVVFGFDDRRDGANRKRLGLFDVASRSIQLVDQPEKFRWGSPVFAPAGRKLAFTSFCFHGCTPEEFGYHIGMLDLDTGDWQILTTYGRDTMRLSPKFSSDGNAILFATAGASWSKEGGSRPATFFGISSLLLESRRETQLLPNVEETTTFQGVGRPSMTHDGDILFTGIAPFNGAFNDRVEKIGLSTIQDLALRLRPDGTLDFLPGLERRSLGSLSASTDGRRVVFIGRSSPSKRGRGFGYDLFLYEGASLRQVTQLETHAYLTDITPDGSIAIFLADETRKMNWSIWRTRLGSGETREILTPEALRMFLGGATD